jgi:hypothetical protein
MSHRKRLFFSIVCGLFLFHTAVVSPSSAQTLSIYGSVRDSSLQKNVSSAVVVATRLRDSVMTAFMRTDSAGTFRLQAIPVDTYQVVISHPLYGDHTILIMGNDQEKEINLHKMYLPPKSIQLTELTVYGYADPVYYKGDTIVYTADSFQVKKNAVVEDLLRKLPGIKVDANGKIYSQGKEVDQVLVDGDEFFGSDPTVATKNLSAASVASVQVYDKANDNASDNSDKDVLKVMDLKLKDDAKKGYFGKMSTAHDYKDFYEDELLLNKFKGKQKISVFALSSNTPRTSFGWNDMYEYGIEPDDNTSGDNEDGMYYTYNDEQAAGIPRTFKTGAYFTDMITSSTKLSLNYTYKQKEVHSESSTASQYFFPDTSYSTDESGRSYHKNAAHGVNMMINQKIDSLNELEIKSKFLYNTSEDNMDAASSYFTSDDSLSRSTHTYTSNIGNNTEFNTGAKWTRSFTNRDRKLTATYTFITGKRKSDGILQSRNYFFLDATPDDSINQDKIANSDKQSQYIGVIYTEPLNKKIKLEFSSDLLSGNNSQDRKTFDIVNGMPSTENPALSNRFVNDYETFRGGLKFIYEVKKQTFALGARFRNIKSDNHNMVTDEHINQDLFNTLPSMSYRYKFSDNKQFSFRYTTDAKLPDVNQLQPVYDNSNPNTIVRGNPDLQPSFKHNFSAWINSYKVVTGSYVFANAYFNLTRNAFANDITYDSIGRTITTPQNVNGNYYAGLYSSANYPILNKWLELGPNINYSYSHNTTFINGVENLTRVTNPTIRLDINHRTDSLEFRLSAGYSYYRSASSLSEQSNQKYSAFDYGASMEITLPLKMSFSTDATYSANRKRAEGYNINTLLWNASLKKNFLKNENLVLSLEATDILNQNIQTERNVSDNVVSDTKSNVIGRYILLKVLFKFNSNKTPNEGDNDE